MICFSFYIIALPSIVLLANRELRISFFFKYSGRKFINFSRNSNTAMAMKASQQSLNSVHTNFVLEDHVLA